MESMRIFHERKHVMPSRAPRGVPLRIPYRMRVSQWALTIFLQLHSHIKIKRVFHFVEKKQPLSFRLIFYGSNKHLGTILINNAFFSLPHCI